MTHTILPTHRERGLVRSSTPLLPDAEVWTMEAKGWACSRILSPVPQLFSAEYPYTYATTLVQGRTAPALVPAEAEPERWDVSLRELTAA